VRTLSPIIDMEVKEIYIGAREFFLQHGKKRYRLPRWEMKKTSNLRLMVTKLLSTASNVVGEAEGSATSVPDTEGCYPDAPAEISCAFLMNDILLAEVLLCRSWILHFLIIRCFLSVAGHSSRAVGILAFSCSIMT
jgi:hypothetical protein